MPFMDLDAILPLRPRSSPILDGRSCLADVLKRAGFNSPTHAVAEYAVFLHPNTVKQTSGRSLFKVIRNFAERGECCEIDGELLMQDDNQIPTNAFLWSANRLGTAKDRVGLWSCHIWQRSDDYRSYTALWNICAMPEFLAALTDKDPEVRAVLRYRAFELYGAYPEGEQKPEEPSDYSGLKWAQPHPAEVDNLEQILRVRLRACRKSRAAVSAGTCGWLFSDFKPDTEFTPRAAAT